VETEGIVRRLIEGGEAPVTPFENGARGCRSAGRLVLAKVSLDNRPHTGLFAIHFPDGRRCKHVVRGTAVALFG